MGSSPRPGAPPTVRPNFCCIARSSAHTIRADPNWYVIDRSLVTGNGTVYLGRPWRNYARVVFQKSWLGANVNSTGWSIWNVGDERTNHTALAEYGNIGLGARGPRSDFSKTLDKPVDILTVLNSTAWVDPAWL